MLYAYTMGIGILISYVHIHLANTGRPGPVSHIGHEIAIYY